MTRHFLHPTGQLATVTEHGWGTSGPIPFDPTKLGDWAEISESHYALLAEEHAADAARDAEALAAWAAEDAAARRKIRLAAFTAAARGDELTPEQEAAALGEHFDSGVERPVLASAKRLGAQVEAAEALKPRKRASA